MKTEIRFAHEKVRFDQDTNTQLVVSITAPKKDWETKRPPVAVIACVDHSGSMDGDPLEKAKKTVLKMADHMGPEDFLGVVVFESSVRPLVKLKKMTPENRDALKSAVGGLCSAGGTAFTGGMLTSFAEMLGADLPAGILTRVIMLTDGQANVGIHDREGILKAAAANRTGVSVSAFGYGPSADQELLADLARQSGGNYAYIQNPDDALGAFAKELGGLLSTFAQDIRVTVQPANGHELVEVVSDVDAEPAGKGVCAKVSDILGEEVRHFVFDVKLAKQSQALPRAMNAFEVTIECQVLQEDGTRKPASTTTKAKVRFVKPGEETTAAEPTLAGIIGNAKLVQAQVAAEVKAKAGDFAGAQGVLRNFGFLADQMNLHTHVAAAANLGEKYASPVAYNASGGYRNSLRSAVTRGVGTSSMDHEAVMMTQSLGVATENSAQCTMKDSFGKDDEGAQNAGCVAPAGPAVVPTAIPVQGWAGPLTPGGVPWTGIPAVIVPTPAVVPAPAPVAPVEAPKKSLGKSRSARW